MHFLSIVTLALGFTSFGRCAVLPRQAKPPAFLLAGDSTTAPAGGWGDAFNALLTNGAVGTNFAVGGTTTASFRARGLFTDVLDSAEELRDTHDVFVTIQFGHNDQKSTSGISLDQFEANLGRMVDEVIAAGGTPILVSSLTRRALSGGEVVENLAEHSAAALSVAAAKGVPSIDLNRKSTDYVNEIGQANADKYNLAARDRTHLNEQGATVFGNMVAGLLIAEGLGGDFITPDAAISTAIEEGTFILP